MIATCGEIAPEDLVAYWAGDLDSEEVDRLDEHLVGCATCTAASARISAVTEGVRALIPVFPNHATLEALRARGHRIRENPIRSHERTTVVFGRDLDLLVHKLTGLDLANASNVGIVVSVEETGDVLIDEPSVPFDRDSGEVIVVCQRHFAEMPPNIVAEVRTREANGPERVARFVIPHIFESRVAE